MKISTEQLKHGMLIKTNNQIYYVIEITYNYIQKYFSDLNCSEITLGFYGLNGLNHKATDLDDIRNYKSMFSLKTQFITIEHSIELLKSECCLDDLTKSLLC